MTDLKAVERSLNTRDLDEFMVTFQSLPGAYAMTLVWRRFCTCKQPGCLMDYIQHLGATTFAGEPEAFALFLEFMDPAKDLETATKLSNKYFLTLLEMAPPNSKARIVQMAGDHSLQDHHDLLAQLDTSGPPN